MRHGLAVLRHTPAQYEYEQHTTLFHCLKEVGRDHFHHREGIKDDMPFICLVKADFSSRDFFFRGHIGGRDDDFIRKSELVDIKFSVRVNEFGKLIISIDSSDRITSYEQSMSLILYSMNEMYNKRADLGKDSGGGPGRKGFYPQSAMKTGRFKTFDKWFEKAEEELVLPESIKDTFLEMNYNLVFVSGEKKTKKQKLS